MKDFLNFLDSFKTCCSCNDIKIDEVQMDVYNYYDSPNKVKSLNHSRSSSPFSFKSPDNFNDLYSCASNIQDKIIHQEDYSLEKSFSLGSKDFEDDKNRLSLSYYQNHSSFDKDRLAHNLTKIRFITPFKDLEVEQPKDLDQSIEYSGTPEQEEGLQNIKSSLSFTKMSMPWVKEKRGDEVTDSHESLDRVATCFYNKRHIGTKLPYDINGEISPENLNRKDIIGKALDYQDSAKDGTFQVFNNIKSSKPSNDRYSPEKQLGFKINSLSSNIHDSIDSNFGLLAGEFNEFNVES
ncbi:MAG: hypothetical protein AB8B67_03835 [Rickettsiaceae bacterium]